LLETRRRSIVKTLSYRVLSTFLTAGVAYSITGSVGDAIRIGLLDTGVKLGAYYFHERLWLRIRFGRVTPPEFRI
jgi:adenylylsulfate kinase